MSQQTSGLRFDIYERVHLADEMVGIRELNSIELVPDITVDAQGDQAVLKGHLLLSGAYIGDDESAGEQALQHRIPVEITLPLNRVQNVSDIRIGIENFDVDLMSTRSLNVTGILSLNGIDAASNQTDAPVRQEEMVFSHRVEEKAPPPVLEAQPEPSEVEPPSASVQSASGAAALAAVPPTVPSAESSTVPVESGPVKRVESQAAEEAEENEELEAAEPVEEIEEENENAAENEAAENENVPASEENEMIEAEKAEEEEANKEIKIAFSGKTASATEPSSIGVKDILAMSGGGSGSNRDAEANAQNAEAHAAAPETAGSERDRLEWRKWFLQRSQEESAFRKVKMCIAQKEDTIETVAERYQKNPRELMLYNGLNEQYLQEGQIVYIPV